MAKKTKLTTRLRDDIRASIIADLPTIDYVTIIQDYINIKAREQLPTELQAECFREYLGRSYLQDLEVYAPNTCYKPSNEDRDFVRAQRELQYEQKENIRVARLSVAAMLENFNYVEDFIATAPKFAKYAPKPDEPTVNLPAIRVEEQLAALGWPKSNEGK